MTYLIWRGRRSSDGTCIVERHAVDDAGGSTQPLDPRFDLRNYSLSGFDWGYEGSGPLQLALALLADYRRTRDPRPVLEARAQAMDTMADSMAFLGHQEFMRRVVALLPYDGWQLTRSELQPGLYTAAYARVMAENGADPMVVAGALRMAEDAADRAAGRETDEWVRVFGANMRGETSGMGARRE
jgi:hypothetical protein